MEFMKTNEADLCKWGRWASRIIEKQKAILKSAEHREAAVRRQIGKKGLVVLPTGCGKSMVYMISALQLVNKIVIVVVPLVALGTDMQCIELGVHDAVWKD